MKLVRINIFIMRPLAQDIIKYLKDAGITDIMTDLGKAPILENKKKNGFLGNLFNKSEIIDQPVTNIQFFINCDKEEKVIHYIVDKGQLQIPGRGSVYGEFVDIQKCNEHCKVNDVIGDLSNKDHTVLKEYMGICCIVQRGQGDHVAQVALDSGAGTPQINYGEGTGVRDKMGLLRITIPAEKEIISMATSRYDAEMVMTSMIKAGKLDQPGKGFIYLHPLGHGVLNMKVSRGIQRAAASSEQIIAAIDEIKGSIEWRKRAELNDGSDNLRYLDNLTDLTLICDEGGGHELTKIAMNAGAAGATISKVKHEAVDGSSGAHVSPSRECCSMIVSENQCENIVNELDHAGAFTDKYQGMILTRKVEKAFTYLGKKKAKMSS